jgi:hypothetical protein
MFSIKARASRMQHWTALGVRDGISLDLVHRKLMGDSFIKRRLSRFQESDELMTRTPNNIYHYQMIE